MKNRLRNNIEKSNEKDDINIKKNFKFLFYPPHKHNKKLKHKIKSKQNTSRTIEINSDVIKNKRKINKKKIKTQINKRKKNVDAKILVFSGYSSSKNMIHLSSNEKITNLENNLKKQKEVIIDKIKKGKVEKKEYDDFELNELEYTEARKYDKRSLLQIYWLH